jgi:uncharacterized protein (DUF4415 family)
MKKTTKKSIMEKHKPEKIMITVSLDADVIEWLKSTGRNWQERMNAILREAMLNSM